MAFSKFIKSFFARFVEAQTTTYAASVAFYTALSLAPILILFVTITSQLTLGFQEELLYEAERLVGSEAAKAVSLVINNAKQRPDLASWSGIFGVVTLLLASGLIFGELREAMNRIFNTTTELDDSATIAEVVVHLLRDRALQIGMALSFLLIMLVSLVFSSILSATLNSDAAIWTVGNIFVSFLFYAGVFALLFRYLPNSRTKWKESLIGGLLTAFLFVVGKELIGLYLGKSALGSAYGAAGSVIVLLAWVYYSALITFVGAHVSFLLSSDIESKT